MTATRYPRTRKERRAEAQRILAAGDYATPSPDEVARSRFDAITLAGWGIPYPPPRGWRIRLETRWHAAGRPTQRPERRTHPSQSPPGGLQRPEVRTHRPTGQLQLDVRAAQQGPSPDRDDNAPSSGNAHGRARRRHMQT